MVYFTAGGIGLDESLILGLSDSYQEVHGFHADEEDEACSLLRARESGPEPMGPSGLSFHNPKWSWLGLCSLWSMAVLSHFSHVQLLATLWTI